MLSRTIEYASRSRPNAFKGSSDPKVKIAAKSAGLGSWNGTIIEIGKDPKGIKDVKNGNIWDIFDVLEYNGKMAKFNEMLK